MHSLQDNIFLNTEVTHNTTNWLLYDGSSSIDLTVEHARINPHFI